MILRVVLLLILLASPVLAPLAHGQSIGCDETPVGPMIELHAWVGQGHSGSRAGTNRTGASATGSSTTAQATTGQTTTGQTTTGGTTTNSGTSQAAGPRGVGELDFGRVPMYGTVCGTTPPLPADVLHGLPPPPGGSLLRDRPAADVLRGP